MKRRTLASGLAILALGAFTGAGSAQRTSGKLSRAELKKLTRSHDSPADHQKLANHYEAVAAEHEADAAEHEALAAEYARNPTGREQKHPMSADTVQHCKTFAEHCRRLAQEARALAAEHAALAKNHK